MCRAVHQVGAHRSKGPSLKRFGRGRRGRDGKLQAPVAGPRAPASGCRQLGRRCDRIRCDSEPYNRGNRDPGPPAYSLQQPRFLTELLWPHQSRSSSAIRSRRWRRCATRPGGRLVQPFRGWRGRRAALREPGGTNQPQMSAARPSFFLKGRVTFPADPADGFRRGVPSARHRSRDARTMLFGELPALPKHDCRFAGRAGNGWPI